jgi:hypothetical protein
MTTNTAAADTTDAVHHSTGSTVARWVARVLLALFGAFGVGATVYFSFYASPEEGGVVNAVDWLVAAWSLATSLGYLYVAVKLGDRTRRTVHLAQGLVLAHVAFGLVKLFGYGETESVFFFAQDALLLALLFLAGRGSPSRHGLH